MPQLTRMFFEDELQQLEVNSIIFRNEQIFSLDYIPDQLPYRSDQLKAMIRLFRGFFNNSGTVIPHYQKILLLYGKSGTGKTVVAKRFGYDFEEIAKSIFTSDIQVKYRYLNCRRSRTVFTLLIQLLKSLIPYFPNRGFSSSELLRLLEQHLRDSNIYLLLTLDEVDILVYDREFHTFLYSISRLNDELLLPHTDYQQKRISLILITRQHNFLSFLDSSTRSSIGKNIINFPPYQLNELVEILKERVNHGIHNNILQDDLIFTIADKAYNKGNARFAIELLWRSIKQAETKQDHKVTSEHINQVESHVLTFNIEWLEDLPIEQKLFLLTVAKLLKQNPNVISLTLTEIKASFRKECEQIEKKIGQGNTSIWLYMKSLASWGFLKTQLISKGRRGRITLISLPLPADLVIKTILRKWLIN